MATNILKINSVAALDGVLLGLQSTKDHAMKLTYLRADFMRFGNGVRPSDHPLYDKRDGFKAVYDAMNARATELGFTILSFGYRKPLNAQ
jgi:hypothetical protein